MKKKKNSLVKKILFKSALIFCIAFIIIILVDKFILPWYVNVAEVQVPNVLGKDKDAAISILEETNLTVVLAGYINDNKVLKDCIILQKPSPGSIVKEGRRIYLYISSGEALVKMPNLQNKTLRDATVTIEKMGLKVGKIDKIESEIPSDIIVSHVPTEGRMVKKGSEVNLTVSVGPQAGMVRVPSLIGMPIKEAEKNLNIISLRLGKIFYQDSDNLLPNTVINQYPSEGNLLSTGGSVDITVSK
ncbi:MAG: PASTA domain-containing protein [Ignavibacteriales bacterium]|nr:PASTA domain-containing protein [Ignavibacteriales bacterium]